jgi:uncharacterized membrane protein YhaH (DUF805 family)
VLKTFEEYTSLKGRAGCLELWGLQIFLIVINVVVYFFFRSFVHSELFATILVYLGKMGIYIIGSLIAFYIIATFVPLIATKVRRLHDLNLSGWWLLLIYGLMLVVGVLFGMFKDIAIHFNIPFLTPELENDFQQVIDIIAYAISFTYFIFLYLVPGKKAKNKYGTSEQEITSYAKKRKKEFKASKKAKKEFLEKVKAVESEAKNAK